MPGCSPFFFFPRYKAFTQVNMWDHRGNDHTRNGRSHRSPRYPMPSSPGLFGSSMRERHRYPTEAIPTSFIPMGFPPSAPYMPLSRSASVDVPPRHPGGPRPRVPSSRGPPPQPTHRVPSGSQRMPSQIMHSGQSHRVPSGSQRVPSQQVHTRVPSGFYGPQPFRGAFPSLNIPPPPPTSPPQRSRKSLRKSLPLERSTQHNQAPSRRVTFASSKPQKYLHPSGFQYSKCTGRKKALCIGINYRGQSRPLRGCINDVRNVKLFLTRYWGYKDGDVVVLVDETEHPRQMPTRKNIIDAMHWLIRDAKPHDSLFFHYSGHGGQVPDQDGDEVGGYDQVIYPVDYQRAGPIVDDEMHRIMVKSLPPGCRLTAVFDSCHSGSALDLPYVYQSDGRIIGSPTTTRARAYKAASSDVVSWCACRDDQTSADTFQGGVAVGAMSYAFATSLSRNPNQSYQELLKSIRAILSDRYRQIPQLSSSHPIDTNLRFIL